MHGVMYGTEREGCIWEMRGDEGERGGMKGDERG